ncbi:MAG: hypothetical protein U0842_13125 [Candidatus Binatia bacterium]
MSRNLKAALIAAALIASARPAASQVLPDPPATQSINCAQDRPKACQRLKALRNLFGPAASTVPLINAFRLVATPESPNPRCRARNLALVCLTDGTWSGGDAGLYWQDGVAGDHALSSEG